MIEQHNTSIKDLVVNHSDKINLFFIRKKILNFWPELKQYPQVLFLDDYSQSPYFAGITDKLTTGSFSCLFAAMLGYKRMYLLGIDQNLVEQIPEAKPVGGSVLKIIETPKHNPNYFFDDYQQAGEKFNIPNSTPNLHYQSWERVKERLEWFGVWVQNCTPYSKLNIFDSTIFEEILKKGEEKYDMADDHLLRQRAETSSAWAFNYQSQSKGCFSYKSNKTVAKNFSHVSEGAAKLGKDFHEVSESRLVISSIFLPTKETLSRDCNFFLVDIDNIDKFEISEVVKCYKYVFIENKIYCKSKYFFDNLQAIITPIDDFTLARSNNIRDIKISFLASSDTHAKFMLTLSMQFRCSQFLIPHLKCKDDGAYEFLLKNGVESVQIHYSDERSDRIKDFSPDFILCSADWTSEFFAIQGISRKLGIPTIALQEGPQDWHAAFYQVINGERAYKIQKPYQHCDVLLSQGSVTLKYIRPRCSIITGNPKIKWHEKRPLPANPKAMINLNFTYVNTKPKYESYGKVWVELAIKACQEMDLDYFVSRHPRDKTIINDKNVFDSNATKVGEHLNSASIVISRFSTISYEALSYQCDSIYFNPHREPMYTFNEELNGAVQVADTYEDLKKCLKKHKKAFPEYFDSEKAKDFLRRHCGLNEQNITERTLNVLSSLMTNNYKEMRLNFILDGCNIFRATEDIPYQKKTVMIFSRNGKQHFSGGRYYSFMIAEALSSIGYRVFFVSEYIPIFFKDLRNYKFHQNIEIVLTKDFASDLPDINVDYLFITPGMDDYDMFYRNGVQVSKERNAKLVLINFESPNWYNKYSPIIRNESMWKNWVYVSRSADLILSISKEGMSHAKEFYKNIKATCIFEYAYPCINDAVADIALNKIRKKEDRVITFARFSHSEHKGCYNIPDFISSCMKGFTLVIIVGAGNIPKDVESEILDKGKHCGVSIEIKHRLSDYEKFMEMAKARILLFPSFFEGFGYPPIEALHVNTSCIVFDLPVLRETCGNYVKCAKLGDWAMFKSLIKQELSRPNESFTREKMSKEYTVAGLGKRLHDILNNL